MFLVERLEKALKSGRKIPLTRLTVIDEDELAELIDLMRTSIPDEIRQAKQVLQQKDRVVAQGQEEASRLVKMGREQAETLVAQHEISRAAEARSHTIIERAQREAVEIRRGADDYAEQILTGLDQRLESVAHQVKSGLIELDNRRNADGDRGDMAPEAAPSRADTT